MLRRVIHVRLLAALLFASSFVAWPAAAADRILVIVPEGVASDVLEAIQIELQLSGLEVVVHRAPQRGGSDASAAALHADIELALLVATDGGATRVQVLRGGASVEIVVESVHPRAVALSVGAAADAARRARAEASRVQPEAVASAVREPPEERESADVELGAPVPLSPSERLAAPSGAEDGADEPEPEPEPEPSEPMGRPARLLLEFGFAVLGAAVLGVPAALLTHAYAVVPDNDEPWLYGFGAAAPIGVALGVYLGGLLAGGDGAIGWTLLGGILGGLVAGGLLLAGAAVDRDPMDRVDPGFTIVGGLASAVLPPLGAMLGFELTIGDPPR